MSIIQKLPLHEIHKIAAGQVVERPASVAKELIENALDAGATEIAVHIKQGGKTLIRVLDNGKGMDPDDAQLCFEKHAASKIRSVDELSTIDTFGFRGEALPSIAAVSKVTLITRTSDANCACKVTVENGIMSAQEAAGNQGTDVSVADLFYNTPARLKFCKSDQTEQRHIVSLVHAFALSHEQVAFKLYTDDVLILNATATTDIKMRLMQLLPSSFEQSGLLAFEKAFSAKGFEIKGYITHHQFGTYDRSLIFSFVNGRWVKNFGVAGAFIKGCKQVIPNGKFPAGIIIITIDKKLVDINTHPRKEEVVFAHPKMVENAIEETITELFSDQMSQKIGYVPFSVMQASSESRSPFVYKPFEQATRLEAGAMPPFEYTIPSQPDHENFRASVFESNTDDQFSVQKTRTEDSTQTGTLFDFPKIDFVERADLKQSHLLYDNTFHAQEVQQRFVGQLFDTYLLIERADELFIVDQHAAHERVLFERLNDAAQKSEPVALLFAHTIHLSEAKLELLVPFLHLFEQQAIIAEPFGMQQLLIKAVPVYLKDANLDELVHEFIALIEKEDQVEEKNFLYTVTYNLRAQIACKAAVKAGYKLDTQFVNQLLKDLRSTKDCFSCPHGRPTGWTITKNELEKKFKRKL